MVSPVRNNNYIKHGKSGMILPVALKLNVKYKKSFCVGKMFKTTFFFMPVTKCFSCIEFSGTSPLTLSIS